VQEDPLVALADVEDPARLFGAQALDVAERDHLPLRGGQRVDRGGSLRIGMGVEDRVRVARNVRAEEESAGLLGGSTAMTHTVTLEIQSALGQPAQLEVFDRWPTTEDKNVTLELVYEKPPHTPYDQADRGAPIRKGMKWRLSLPPGGKANIEYQYRIVFSAKSELVGGNRRD
jgi:hypothetical protein